MTAGQLKAILSTVPTDTEIALLLTTPGGEPDYSSATDVRCVQVDYTGEGRVESVSVVFR